jgi:phosphoribosyl-ATP pyrophosphohydrolase
MADTLARLEQIIAERRQADPASSYVARLLASGRAKIAQKVGEEAVETVIAALAGSQYELVSEAADLLFHLAVLLAEQGLSLDNVMVELERREGISGIAEKAGRTSSSV